MIGGMDAERGTVTAGGRGYYLMVGNLGNLKGGNGTELTSGVAERHLLADLFQGPSTPLCFLP